jgi:hypothetical protein
MPETDGAPLASLRDAVIFMLGSGGVGRVATSTTGLYLASLRLALAILAGGTGDERGSLAETTLPKSCHPRNISY